MPGRLIVKTGAGRLTQIGKINPYCVIRVGNEVQSTNPHKKGNQNPMWGDAFTFTKNLDDDFLELEVWNKNKIFKNEMIAEAKISLAQTLAGGNAVSWIPVTNLGKDAGEILLQFEYYPEGSSQNALLGQQEQEKMDPSFNPLVLNQQQPILTNIIPIVIAVEPKQDNDIHHEEYNKQAILPKDSLKSDENNKDDDKKVDHHEKDVAQTGAIQDPLQPKEKEEVKQTAEQIESQNKVHEIVKEKREIVQKKMLARKEKGEKDDEDDHDDENKENLDDIDNNKSGNNLNNNDNNKSGTINENNNSGNVEVPLNQRNNSGTKEENVQKPSFIQSVINNFGTGDLTSDLARGLTQKKMGNPHGQFLSHELTGNNSQQGNGLQNQNQNQNSKAENLGQKLGGLLVSAGYANNVQQQHVQSADHIQLSQELSMAEKKQNQQSKDDLKYQEKNMKTEVKA